MAESQQYCTFYVDKRLYGIEVNRVQEVLRQQEMTHVPLAKPVVRGLINLRGQIVTALDLRIRLDLPGSADPRELMNVVIRTSDGAISLLVDQIGEVIDAPKDNFESVPETLRGQHRELIQGAYKLNKELLLVLDTDKLIHP